RNVKGPHDEDRQSGEQQPHDRIPVALDGEDQGPDREAEPEQVERISQDRVPVAYEYQCQKALKPSGLLRSLVLRKCVVAHGSPFEYELSFNAGVIRPSSRCRRANALRSPSSSRGSVAKDRAALCSACPPPSPSSTAGRQSPVASHPRGSG